MKFLLTSFLIFTGIFRLEAQSLFTSNPTLNAGGYINDVWEDTLNNKVYIAGNFTSVNGSARRNIARLTYSPLLNTLTLDNWIPVTAMIGEIRCIAKYNNDLHFGGNFTSTNGNATVNYWGIINMSTTAVNTSFQPDAGGIIHEINDFEVDGPHLYVAGQGIIYDDGDARFNFGKFDFISGNVNALIDPLPINPSFNWGGTMEVVRLHLNGNRIYICGRNFGGPLNDGVVAFDKNTMITINTFNPSFTFEQVIDCETHNGKVYIVNSKIWPGGESVLELDENSGAVTLGAVDASASGTPHSIAIYKDYLFIAGNYTFLQGTAHTYLGAVFLSGTTIPREKVNWIPAPNTGIDNRYSLHRWKNRLYVSDNNLTSISSSSVNGLAVYCLEPLNPMVFTTSFTNACPGDVKNYILQLVPYATGYTWWYSGNDVTITGGTSHNIQLTFGENATGGTLFVSPYSRCSLYSDTLELNITVNPLPDANAGLDSAFNCERTSIELNGNSVSSPVIFQWNGPSSYSSSLQNPAITLDGEYILTVTHTPTGCIQYDSVLISQDTITPDMILPPGPFILTCLDTTVVLQGNSNTIPTDFYWRKQTTGTIYTNPFNADSIGAYFLVVTNTRNKCKDSSFVTVTENRTAPDIEISSHSGITTLTIDTLTCIYDSILVTGFSFTSNTGIHWEDTSGIIASIDSMYITISKAYTLVITDTLNGCHSEYPFFIDENKTLPQIQLPMGLTDITCSRDTIILDGEAITPNTNIIWTDIENNLHNDPITADTTGYYILTGTNPANGCTISDSVLVTEIPLIETIISNDTLVCAGSNVNLSVSAIGNFGTLDYSWTGTSLNTPTVTVNNTFTQEYFVTVTDGNCIGYDSVTISIPPSMYTDSILSFASCDSTIGEIQIYIQGGISPYQYSIDGANFQSSNSFIIPFGDYLIAVVDSLGCVFTDSASVNDQSQLPEPDFLISTYSFVNDTLVLVNISNPQPDSLEWVFPSLTQIVIDDIESPWIILPDTGTFQVTLKGYFGNCYAEKIKTIYVKDSDTSVANFFNNHGIDTCIITPNPNNGIFDLEITFFRKQDFSVRIYDLSGNLQWSDYKTEDDYYFQNISLVNLQNGTYLIRVIAEFDTESLYFVIQH